MPTVAIAPAAAAAAAERYDIDKGFEDFSGEGYTQVHAGVWVGWGLRVLATRMAGWQADCPHSYPHPPPPSPLILYVRLPSRCDLLCARPPPFAAHAHTHVRICRHDATTCRQTYIVMRPHNIRSGSYSRRALFRFGNWCYEGEVDFGVDALHLGDVPDVLPALQKQQVCVRCVEGLGGCARCAHVRMCACGGTLRLSVGSNGGDGEGRGGAGRVHGVSWHGRSAPTRCLGCLH